MGAQLKTNEKQYWQTYLDQLQPSADLEEPIVTAGYAGSPEISDRLLMLYLDGTKTAGSSLLEDFVATNDETPRVGNHWICLASGGEPRCILRTIRVETHNFRDVPEEIAVAEGEGDLSVEYWKRVHAERYAPHLQEWGLLKIGDATVVTEFFQVVFR